MGLGRVPASSHATTVSDLSSENRTNFTVSADDAVETLLKIAAGELDEAAVAAWLAARLDPSEG